MRIKAVMYLCVRVREDLAGRSRSVVACVHVVLVLGEDLACCGPDSVGFVVRKQSACDEKPP